MKFLINIIKGFVRLFWGWPLLRKIFTSNYTSGRIALGERNNFLRNRTWITIDTANSDFNMNFRSFTPLPFENDSQDVIYSAHAIEHIPDECVTFLLKESYRVLKKGGYIRIEAPDAGEIISSYKKNDRQFVDCFSSAFRTNLVEKRGYPSSYAEDHNSLLGILSNYMISDYSVPVIADKKEVASMLETLKPKEFSKWCVSLQTGEQLESGGHINPIFYDNIHDLLGNVGFKNILKMGANQTRIPKKNLQEVERPHRAFYSLIVEAEK